MGALLESYRRNRSRSVLRKVVNSYLTPRFLYKYVYDTARWERILRAAKEGKWKGNVQASRLSGMPAKMFTKLLWFWPTDEKDIEPWITAGPGDRKTYSKFIAGTPCDRLFCDVIEQYCPDHRSSILELGSNVGRIINILVERGYTDIQGVELNHKAIEASSEIFGSQISKKITWNALQPFLMEANDRQFDCVITYGATIELVHPAFDVVRHMCRVARFRVVICVNENQHSFPRFYRTEFERRGFYTCYYQRAVGEVCNTDTENSIIAFERIQENDTKIGGDEFSDKHPSNRC